MPKEVVGFYISKNYYLCSEPTYNKDIQTGKQLLHWLASFGQTLNVLWDLEYSASCILSKFHLSIEQLSELMETTKLEIDDCLFTYIPSKFMSVKAGRNWGSPFAMYSNGSQYFTAFLEEVDRDTAYKYACEAKQIGMEVRDSLAVLKVNARNLISPINQFAKAYFQRMHFPLVDELNAIDPQIGEYSFNALEAGLFECRQKGHFNEVYDFDINGAYGSSLSALPNINKGEWKYVKEYKPDAPIGFYKTKVTITDSFSPIGFRAKDFNSTPIGTWDKYLSQQQIQCIDKWKLGSVNVEDGYVWTPIEWQNIYAPLIRRLFEIKESSTGIQKDVMKRVLSGIWGIMGQIIKGKFGEYFQPVIHALVEINTRLKVFELCKQNNIEPISIALDGVVTDRPLENINIGTDMGQWKLSHQGKCIAINSDLVLIEGKDSKQVFTATYEWAKNEIENNPDASRYTMTRNSCVTVGKVVQNPKLLDRLGEIVPTNRSIDLNVEFKRIYPEHPKTGKELLSGKIYNSMPVDVGMLEVMELPEVDDTLLTSSNW